MAEPFSLSVFYPWHLTTTHDKSVGKEIYFHPPLPSFSMLWLSKDFELPRYTVSFSRTTRGLGRGGGGAIKNLMRGVSLVQIKMYLSHTEISTAVPGTFVIGCSNADVLMDNINNINNNTAARSRQADERQLPLLVPRTKFLQKVTVSLASGVPVQERSPIV